MSSQMNFISPVSSSFSPDAQAHSVFDFAMQLDECCQSERMKVLENFKHNPLLNTIFISHVNCSKLLRALSL